MKTIWDKIDEWDNERKQEEKEFIDSLFSPLTNPLEKDALEAFWKLTDATTKLDKKLKEVMREVIAG